MKRFPVRGKVVFGGEEVRFIDAGVSFRDIDVLHLPARSSFIEAREVLSGEAEAVPSTCRIESYMGAKVLECLLRRKVV